jgi:hypothetical protein
VGPLTPRAESPTGIRTSIGNVNAIFALDGWVMLEVNQRSTQSQCRRRRELARKLVALGLRDDEADEVAHALWRQRPGDASMQADSQSVVLAIGNQWVAAAVLVLLFAALAITVVYVLLHPR